MRRLLVPHTIVLHLWYTLKPQTIEYFLFYSQSYLGVGLFVFHFPFLNRRSQCRIPLFALAGNSCAFIMILKYISSCQGPSSSEALARSPTCTARCSRHTASHSPVGEYYSPSHWHRSLKVCSEPKNPILLWSCCQPQIGRNPGDAY